MTAVLTSTNTSWADVAFAVAVAAAIGVSLVRGRR